MLSKREGAKQSLEGYYPICSIQCMCEADPTAAVKHMRSITHKSDG